jgi:glucokinase
MIILAADIGGTNGRFAVFEKDDEDRFSLRERHVLPTASAGGFSQLVDQLAKSKLADWLPRCTAVVIAVPGPVRNGQAPNLPNVSWSLSTSEIHACFPKTPGNNVHLINDFVAHVMACQTGAMDDAICVQRGERDPAGVVSAIGAGTGIGFCSLSPHGDQGYVVLPSEAGHQDFPFQAGDERAYEDFLRKETGRTTIDANTVVSGGGLALLHKYVVGEDITPEEVSPRLTAESNVSRQFATFYGRVARNYALCLLPTGGLYITGGVVAKNRFLVDHDAFRVEFTASTAHHDLLKRIPIFLNINEESGLWGAAFYAKMMPETRTKQETGIGIDA